MFKKILIANRGEVAVRIINACKELGITSVLIHTENEKDSLPVNLADEKYILKQKDNGNGISINPYLDMHQIITIAKNSRAQAIHPGYGFLAENSGFAQLCKDNDIKFIGPSPEVMRRMGDKLEAKSFVSQLNIPVVPGYPRPVQDIKQVQSISKDIGFPVILKAAAGGGGRGIRVVNNKEELMVSFQSVQKEVQAAFGDSKIYVEKCIMDPRHIEFQIVGDKHGNVVHLGERECSIQRKHQKLIEEAPSTALTPELRTQMGQAAVLIAKSTGYEGAGSVEFILDGENYYFMEMNTRLQVEHAITERITGIDLVKEQIRIAYGNTLSYSQEDINLNGWAIECRINAESIERSFMPSIGTITKYDSPEGPGISLSSCVDTGSVIFPDYDSMIAKLIVYGNDREEAIARTRDALEQYNIEGVETTIPLHKAIVKDPFFISGEINTSFINNRGIIERFNGVSEVCRKSRQNNHKNNHIIIAAAIAHHLRARNISLPAISSTDPWTAATRQETVRKFEFHRW